MIQPGISRNSSRLGLIAASLMLLAGAGCVSGSMQLQGVSRGEAWCAALDALSGERFERDYTAGRLSRRFQPGAVPQAGGVHQLVSVDVGSRVSVNLRKSRQADSVELEVMCTQSRAMLPVAPAGAQRDPEWEAYYETEILDRLTWNRLRVGPGLPPAVFTEIVQAAYRELGLDVELRRGEVEGDAIELLTSAGRQLAFLHEASEESPAWFLVAGPARVFRGESDDDLLADVSARIAAAGGEVLELTALPRR